MKKFYFCILLLGACIGSLYAEDIAQTGDLYFGIDTWNGTAYVMQDESYKSLTEVTIPSNVEYNGQTYTVDRISYYAFYGCESLTTITMPNTIKSIGYEAFRECFALNSITMSDQLTDIGSLAFHDCTSLQSITLPNTLTSLGWGTFCRADLTSVTIPSSLTTIESRMFEDCKNLTSVTIPNSITSISSEAFLRCESLTTITLPNSIISLGSSSFSGCKSLTSINLPNSLVDIGGNAFRNCESLTSVVIPNSITSISSEIFYGCSNLKSITLPNGLKKIGTYAFAHTAIESIEMPHTVISTENYIFYNCKNLKSVTLSNSLTRIERDICWNCISLESITIPDGVKSIGGNAFNYCQSLKSVVIPNSVTSIEDYTFYSCYNLDSLTISTNVTSIDDCAFCSTSIDYIAIHAGSVNELVESDLKSLLFESGMSRLNSFHIFINGVEQKGDFVIPEGVTKINKHALSYCSELSSVEVSSSVTSIGEYAFYGVSSVNINATTPPTITSTNIIDEDAFIVLPDAATLATYQSTPIWEEFGTRLVTKDAMQLREVTVAANNSLSSLHKTIGEENLLNTIQLKVHGSINSYDIMLIRNKMLNLRYLDLSDAEVKACPYEYYSGFCTHDNKLEDHSFSELNLRVVHLPKNLEEIYECFLSCPHLDTVYCQPGLKRIGTSAFNNCPSLRYVGVHEGLKEIGDYAFYSTPNLHTVNLPSTLESIGYYAFNSSGINVVTIPANVSYIGSEAFRGCKMESLVFEPGGKLNTISSEIFSDLSNLKTINWENSNITRIEYRGMANCPQLKITAFPKNLRYISDYAFENCSSIDSIVLPARLEEIGAHAFQYCHSVKVIKIPSTVRQIHDNAFYGCSNVTSVYTHTIEPTKINQQTFSCYKTATLFVPKTSYYNYYYNTQWSQFIKLKEYEEEYNYFYLYGDYYLGGEYGNITGDPDGDLFPGSGLITVGNDKVDVHNIHYYAGPDHFTGEWNYPSLITDNNLSIDTLFIHLSQRMYEWSFMTFPYDIDRAVLECNSEFVVRYYDGQIRANNGEGGWQNVPVGQLLLNGKGYIFQSANGDTLTMTFPKPNLPNKDIAVPLYQYNSVNPWDANWNMVGNPFLAYFDMNALTGFTYPVVAWNGYGYDTYRPGDDEYHFKPLESFFIQNVDLTKINFPIDGRETLTQAKSKLFSAPARRNTDSPTTRFIVNINLSDSTYTDRTRVVFNNQASVDYEMGVDASKMISTTAPVQLYTIGKSNEQYSINERPATIDGEMIQLGYYAAYAGEFTLSASRMDTTIMIYDNVEKQYVDLSLGEYTFNTEAGFNNSRFAMCATEKQDTPSSIQDVNMENLSSVSVYTTTGQTIAENVDFSTLHLPAGVYMIRSNNTIFKIVLP